MVKAMLLDVNYLVILPDVHRDTPPRPTHEGGNAYPRVQRIAKVATTLPRYRRRLHDDS
jgi:hypothetical protein